MANEYDEFNRYWHECAGVWQSSRVGNRPCIIQSLRAGIGHRIEEEHPIVVNVWSESGGWTSRTFKYGSFLTRFKPLPHRSQMINADGFIGYYSYSTRRQYLKGVTIATFTDSLRLTEAHLDMMAAWEDRDSTLVAAPNWTRYLQCFFDEYPSPQQALEDIFSGGYYGRAFSRNFAFVNNPNLRGPVLYYRNLQAGVMPEKGALILDSRFEDLGKRLVKWFPGLTITLKQQKKRRPKPVVGDTSPEWFEAAIDRANFQFSGNPDQFTVMTSNYR